MQKQMLYASRPQLQEQPSPPSARPLNVLVSAYACGPNWGSEIGTGWNWVAALAQYCRLAVITEGQFKNELLDALDEYDFAYRPEFHFINVSDKVRARCWHQGDWRFYKDYKKWQWQAYLLASRLSSQRPYDLAHQLNMIGYREPGYLWKLPLPFIWGPVGGFACIPWGFIPSLGLKGAVYHSTRNILNRLQMNCSIRVRRAADRTAALVTATNEDRNAILRLYHKDSELLNETGAKPHNHTRRTTPYQLGRPLRICWCGKLVSGKAPSLALRAVAAASSRVPLELHIVGTGHQQQQMRKLALKLGISRICHWHGKVEHEIALQIIAGSHVMLFSSLQEGTPHVVLEALSSAVPVICHDACGLATVINDSCGIKVPFKSPAYSINGFAEAVINLATNPALLKNLSLGALERAKQLSWDNKAKQMLQIYSSALI